MSKQQKKPAGKPMSATELEAAIRREPASAPLHCELGLAHYRSQNFLQAEKYFALAIKLDPSLAPAHAGLAGVLRDTGRWDLAEKGYRHALKLDPENALAWSGLGWLFFLAFRGKEAVECFRRSLSFDPSVEVTWVRLLEALERNNDLESAFETLGGAKAKFPDSPGIAMQEARLLRRKDRAAEAVPLLLSSLGKLQRALPQGHPFWADYHSELGQCYDRAGEYAKAFESFRTANAVRAATPQAARLDRAAFRTGTIRLRQEYKPPAPLPPTQGETPVFLVGFPRSGTTLLDQILSSHPKLYVAEEKPVLDNLLRTLSSLHGEKKQGWWEDALYPASLHKVTQQDAEKLRAQFFAEHGAAAKGRILVDKQPLNMIHAGFIRQVFPGAKIIMALRHPCDSVLSCFMQNFALNTAMVSFFTLKDAALLYDAAFGLWEDYKTGAYAIRYEDVVADFRPAVEGLLNYLGLPWDDAVLEYDKTAQNKGRTLNTASYNQVTEKIYTRARGRWLKYREQMQPVLEILEPHALKWGYSMDAE